jgi:hypothetical protein
MIKLERVYGMDVSRVDRVVLDEDVSVLELVFDVVWRALKEIEGYPCECGVPIGEGDCPVCIAFEAFETMDSMRKGKF